MTRFRILAALCGLALLSGCAAGAQFGAQALSDPSGTAAGAFGIPAKTVSIQVGAEIDQIAILAAKLQMLKAQLDGTPMTLPALPGVVPMTVTPVPGIPGTFPSSPPVSPSQRLRKQVARDLTRWPTWEQLAEQ